MELGNMLFGNSRGNFPFPDRDIVNTKEWQELLSLINSYSYGFVRGHVKDNGKYSYKNSNGIIFSIMPYYWGDCTCGADEQNKIIYEKAMKEFFNDEERRTYEAFEEIHDLDCPAFEDEEIPDNKLIELCTCGCAKKNIELRNKKKLISDKINKFKEKVDKETVYHNESCPLVQHNFIYHPGQEDEFWIEWYKYPFRDSYMNKDLCIKEILDIFKDCINEIKNG